MLINGVNERAAERSRRTDESYLERRLGVGDVVLRRFEGRPTKLHPLWDGPFIICAAKGSGVFSLKDSNGHILRMNVNGSRLKRYLGSTDKFYYSSQELRCQDELSRTRK